MNFDLGDDVNALRDMVHRWAQERIAPIAQEVDLKNEFPNELWREMGELGLLGVTTSEAYGGANMSYLAHVIVVEEIARASASIAAEKYGGRVQVFDSQAASAGIGMMVLRAHELLSEGAELEGVVRELERMRDDHIVRFVVATLDYLRKNGRIGGAQAILGNLLNIKPILTVREGVVDAAGRVRGEKRALKEMVKTFSEWRQGREQVRIFYLYTGAEEAVHALREEIRSLGGGIEEVYTSEIGAVIASHTGPGIYGYYAYSL